ncbi:hypothetical protein ACIOK4_13650 [Streptomyces bottropensis]|uniref:hypothetical protein n=1 Tax=Streptomyces bottropensis TaxID=42235 RepID=UPI0038093647
MTAADPSHNAAHDFPLAERLVNELIRKWLDTQLGIELAGCGDATPEEQAVRKAIDQIRHLALANYRDALTPKILDELRRSGLLSQYEA